MDGISSSFESSQASTYARAQQSAIGTGATRPQNISTAERLFSTVGGSALVLAGLAKGRLSGLIMTAVGGALAYRGATGHCHLYDVLGIDSAEHSPSTAVPAQQGFKVEKSITINRPAKDLYSFWRDLKNLPRVMDHLISVQTADEKRSHWVAKTVGGKQIEWDAEIINEREPELIAWRSLPGGDMDSAGSVHFKSLGHERGTEVVVSLKYNPPAGKLGATIASMLGGGLEQELEQDLREFKSVMEAGKAPTIAGQPRGNA